MFGWFRPRCPLDLREQVWTEEATRFLIGKLGVERVRKARVVLPTREYFPGNYEASFEDGARVFRLVCGHMGVDPDRISCRFYEQKDHPDALGLYFAGDPPTILLSDTALNDEETLIATASHETAHEILLGGGLLSEDNPEHEPMTDLLTVLLGMGVFAANSAVRNYGWGTVGRQGYLPARMLGYAFALTAWLRNDAELSWAWALQPDAAHALKAGLRYLRKADDCLLDRAASFADAPERAESELAAWLECGVDTRTLAALWELFSRADLAEALRGRIAARLSARHPQIRTVALDLLAAQRVLPDELARLVVARLSDSSAEVRRSAAAAVTALRIPADRDCDNGLPVSENLRHMLHEDDLRNRVAAADALAEYGPTVRPLVEPRLLHLLAGAVVSVTADRVIFAGPRGGIGYSQSLLHPPLPDAITAYLSALEKIGVDVAQASEDHFAESSAGRHELILAALRDHRKAQRRDRLQEAEP